LVVDSSEPLYDINMKVGAVQEILGSEVPGGRILVALNKCDVDPDRMVDLTSMVMSVLDPLAVVPISALTGEGISSLMDAVNGYLRPPLLIRFSANNTTEAATLISRIYENFYVESVEYSDKVKVVFRCTHDDVDSLMDRVYSLPGIIDVSSEEVSKYVR